jgi:DNA topoisomerase-3
LYPKKETEKDEDTETVEEQVMPNFIKGEKGEHTPELLEKQTQPPKMHTEATLLRAMETAGKQMEDEELRELMKDNGIGRPSTRANIIETLFRRNYVVREKKNLVPTQTGIQLINTIQNELLKSAELTGQWERKLRLIEKGEYDPGIFLGEMKEMVSQLVDEVKLEQKQMIDIEQSKEENSPEKEEKPKASGSKKPAVKKIVTKPVEMSAVICPKCNKGTMLKGKTAFGCSEYKNSCTFKVMFEQYGKMLTEKQLLPLIQNGKSHKIKGLTIAGQQVDAALMFDSFFNVVPAS